MLVNSNFNFQNQNTPQFKARLGQKQLAEVVDYASQKGCLPELSFCLKQLDKMKGKEAQIFIKQGANPFQYRDNMPMFWAMQSLVIDGKKLWADVVDRLTKRSHSAEMYDVLANIATRRSLLSPGLAIHNGWKRFSMVSPENATKYLEHNVGITAEKILKKFSIKEEPHAKKVM